MLITFFYWIRQGWYNSKRQIFFKWYRNCKITSIKGNRLDSIHKQFFFDSYGFSPPQKLSRFFIKRNGHCLFSEYKKQDLTSKRDSVCAGHWLYISYLTSLRKGFWICCFEIVLSNIFLKINDNAKNKNW